MVLFVKSQKVKLMQKEYTNPLQIITLQLVSVFAGVV